MSSRLVSVAAPYLTLYLPAVTFKQLPFLVFGFGALVASMASIFVPESLGHPLPDTLEEAAQFGTKSFWSCWSRKKLEDEIACQRLRNLENKENWEFINITKAELLQVGNFFLIHLFARENLLVKKLEIEETKTI